MTKPEKDDMLQILGKELIMPKPFKERCPYCRHSWMIYGPKPKTTKIKCPKCGKTHYPKA